MTEVLMLFLIPIGGGIPAGVLLAKSKGIGWIVMSLLYFVSDVILACVFEPLVLLAIRLGKNSPKFTRFAEAFKKSTDQMISKYGLSLGPVALVMVAFGTDPMTGRIATIKAGHGPITGWILTIAGDMLFYGLIAVSTLLLNNILGDGTLTAVIIVVAMMVVPGIIRRVRARFQKTAST